MKPIKGQIIKAPSRAAILEYILKNHAALYVDQVEMLLCCGLDNVQIPKEDFEHLQDFELEGMPPQLNKPLLVDMQTANAMKTVRDYFVEKGKTDRVEMFDNLSWTKAAKFAWSCVS